MVMAVSWAIINNIKVPILWDTGAQRSIMPERFICQLGLVKTHLNSHFYLNGIGGVTAASGEIDDQPLLLGKHIYHWDFLVSDRDDIPILLGMDFVEYFKALIIMSSHEVHLYNPKEPMNWIHDKVKYFNHLEWEENAVEETDVLDINVLTSSAIEGTPLNPLPDWQGVLR